MDKSPVRATPGEGMHSVVRIKPTPDSDQICIHLMANSKEGHRRPIRVVGAGGSAWIA